MPEQKTFTVVSKVTQEPPPWSTNQVLCCWRIRGSKLEAALPSHPLRSVSVTGLGDSAVLVLGFYLHRDSRGEKYVICCAVRDEEDEQLKGSETTRENP